MPCRPEVTGTGNAAVAPAVAPRRERLPTPQSVPAAAEAALSPAKGLALATALALSGLGFYLGGETPDLDQRTSTQSTAESEGPGSEGSDRWPWTVPPQVGLGNCYLAVD